MPVPPHTAVARSMALWPGFAQAVPVGLQRSGPPSIWRSDPHQQPLWQSGQRGQSGQSGRGCHTEITFIFLQAPCWSPWSPAGLPSCVSTLSQTGLGAAFRMESIVLDHRGADGSVQDVSAGGGARLPVIIKAPDPLVLRLLKWNSLSL